ncbi:glycerate kinase [Ferrimonas lipolytica]|uniref:Glycerate kinase n=1 Tax=Ferrimonas lipolytica TaxID=2724191 RepID=A0A6H1UCT3_9GAMM|nr:glycerate kinase [Ferrimonas lipolytica]QIZ76016.1 glycerate kinase [Ferrimonas lipolytica]
MKIVVAPDSFKESLTAMEAATQIEAGILAAMPTAKVVKLPAADGGEGTTQTLVDATGGRFIEITACDPLGRPNQAKFALLGDGKTAVVEMAEASGLHLVAPEQRNPLNTCSFGTGELIKAALDCGIDTLLLGLGGSATNDGGAGMVKALGAKLLDADGNHISSGGAALAALSSIDLSGIDKRLQQIDIQVACDVDNPLCGATGASAIFGPQKGATEAMVQQLDSALAHFGRCIEQQLNIDVINNAGAGAAGGMGAGAIAFLKATLRPGVDLVLDAIALDSYLADADLVITGEGRLDAQSVHGKTPIGVAKRAKQFNLPVIAIAGSLKEDAKVLSEHGLDAMFACVPAPMSFELVKLGAAENLKQTATNVIRVWSLAQKLEFN